MDLGLSLAQGNEGCFKHSFLLYQKPTGEVILATKSWVYLFDIEFKVKLDIFLVTFTRGIDYSDALLH